jgi:hypothetical protein
MAKINKIKLQSPNKGIIDKTIKANHMNYLKIASKM